MAEGPLRHHNSEPPEVVLVTGASGFVASRVISDLLQVGRAAEDRPVYHVRAAVRGDVHSPRYDILRRLGEQSCALPGLGRVDDHNRLELVSLDLGADTGWDQ